MGYDRKYGQVTTEHGDIPADEPVIVFRARDLATRDIFPAYGRACAILGSPPRHLDILAGTEEQFREWREANPDKVRVPDSERSREWLAE